MQEIVIYALYKFVYLPKFRELAEPLKEFCIEHGVMGTLLLAEEGINGTISGTQSGIDAVIDYLHSQPGLDDLIGKSSYAAEHPFHRMKVKLKEEIVRLGRPEVDPVELVGTYVEPKEWNALISDPDVLVIDTRNDYEIHVGTFQHAVDPHTRTFTQFPEYVKESLDKNKHKKVAMFCTGGIRCEKATSYLLGQGFENVYHLKGGILKYLEEVPEEESLWQGECFVFDNRVTVNHALQPGSYGMCYACKHPLSAEEMKDPAYIEGMACPHCHGQITPEQWASFEERQKQVKLAEARGEKHIGQQIANAALSPDNV